MSDFISMTAPGMTPAQRQGLCNRFSTMLVRMQLAETEAARLVRIWEDVEPGLKYRILESLHPHDGLKE